MKLALVLSLALALPFAVSSCDKPRNAPSKPGPGGPLSSLPGAPAALSDEAGAEESAGEGPIQLTEERLQKYIAYRKELQPVTRKLVEDIGKLSKAVDGKSTDLGKATTGVFGAARIGEGHDAAVQALQRKYGFTESQDKRLWDAIGTVLSARAAENPLMQDSMKSFREAQAKGGEEKAAADEFFKSMEENEKASLEEARKEYGVQCVDILLKHTKELFELQAQELKAVMGPEKGGEQEKK